MGTIYNDISGKLQEAFNTYANTEKLTGYMGAGLKIIIILIAMSIGIRFINIMVDRFFDQKSKLGMIGEQKKVNTLRGIVKSLFKYIIYFVAFTPILETIGIRVSSLIAAAGIGGLAIGFGAQNLVRDVITGFFILLEDQFQVGDYIEAADRSGVVQDITLRITVLKDFNGDLHIIPNGKIDQVTNKSRESNRAWVDIGVSYKEDIDRVMQILDQICADMAKENDKIIEGPMVLGVSNLAESQVVISIMANTLPMEQWDVERELRKRIKNKFDENGIEMPYRKQVILEEKKAEL